MNPGTDPKVKLFLRSPHSAQMSCRREAQQMMFLWMDCLRAGRSRRPSVAFSMVARGISAYPREVARNCTRLRAFRV